MRVSSADQNEARQIYKMRELGIDDRNIYIDKKSGKNFDRHEYQIMRNRAIHPGDLVYIDALDRLGRDYDGIIREWKYITRDLKADIIILENTILFDSRRYKEMGDLGKLMEDQFLSLLSYVAEQERKKIRQRQLEGIEAARRDGRTAGRPKINISEKFDKFYKLWKEETITATEAMKQLGLTRSTFYRQVKEVEQKK